MRKTSAGLFLALALAAGCSATAKSGSSTVTIKNNEVPAAVQGEFYSEHPYAKMSDPQRVKNDDGSVNYIIPYTRSDNTKGTATYAEMGELKNDTN